MVRLIEYRQLTSILAMFLIVQLVGLIIAFYLVSPSEVYIGQATSGGSVGVIFYFIYLIIAAVILFFLFKKWKGPRLFQGIEAIVVVSASFYLFIIVLSAIFPNGSNYVLLASFAASVLLIAAKNRWPSLRNFTAVVASVGVGLVLGIYFGFFAAFVFMALIAAYDYVAVFVTKHMITLGRESVNRNLAFMVGTYDVEMVPRGYVKGKEAQRLRGEFKEVNSKKFRQLMRSGGVPMPSFSALGAGDLAIPLMVAVSAYTTYFSYFLSASLVVFSCFGLVFAMYVSKHYMMALPAIPPLFAFVSIGFGANVLLSTPSNWHFYGLLFAEGVVVLALMVVTAINQNRKHSGSRIFTRRSISSRS
ncbi:MAG: hypothetical protein KGH57_01405 [Candidatus Micrarchaeota archaeon]|nr:hypothetical protein [Candidatus Micrarchaeota archaeon]